MTPLGERPMVIGANPVAFDSFKFEGKGAYPFFAYFSVENLSNVFSKVRLYPRITIEGSELSFLIPPINLEIVKEPFAFLYPFSEAYGKKGTCEFLAERVSLRRGTADREPLLFLELYVDEDDDVKSWLS